ncbi:hypothetical protein [Pseudorhodoferax soli]|uniref:Uncharacterized protein n=1 Tax=Pseudorhodoferax soli TaxID=545864 RepID=A0A368XBI6_9BURK|nr:hypothetical protein [Pseudorhodoferax soli]RCW65079.1 hypothetical protein DES41_1133 [Pseudorhodoferax soli]
MRRLIFWSVLLCGVGLGWLWTLDEALGVQLIVMCVGGMFGGAIGGGLSEIGSGNPKLQPSLTEEELHPIPGMGDSFRDREANYWRDEDHPPFMKPPPAEHGAHMLDADKNV